MMVTLAIILAAVVSQFATELTDILPKPVQAGLSVNEDYNPNTGTYDIEIVWSQEGTVSSIRAVKPSGSMTPSINSIGQSITVNSVESGESIRIIGTLDDGTKGVVQEISIG